MGEATEKLFGLYSILWWVDSMANKRHLAVCRGHRFNHWRQQNPGVIFDLSGADLRNANFWRQNLQNSNFRGANLQYGNLEAVDFRNANLRNTDLRNSNLSGANLSGADLRNANLCGAKLVNVNLSLADISGADLSQADISDADLQAVQALGTDFTEAQLTGVCLGDWNINSETELSGVSCDYVYLQPNQQERRPHNGYFASGEFVTLFQKVLETVDLIFADGIDWKAFFASFAEVYAQYQHSNLSIQAIEKKNGGAFVIRLEVNQDVDKAIIEKQIRVLYENELRVLETQYRAELKAKDSEINIYRQQSADLIEIVKLQATRPINVEAKAVAASQSDSNTFNNDLREAKIGNFANQVQDSAHQQTNQYNYASPEKQTLAEAADEIQRLLRQLEETNPTATEIEQVAYVNVAAKPDIKQRAISALKAGGDTAIDEFFLENKYLKVGKAVVKAWLQPSG
jgi:uncharacterized protein YjbI with pentapeptide repeats